MSTLVTPLPLVAIATVSRWFLEKAKSLGEHGAEIQTYSAQVVLGAGV